MPELDHPLTRYRLRDVLLDSAADSPEKSFSFGLTGGGYVQWLRLTDVSTTTLHIEISEGGDYSEPMPDDLVHRLAGMGWERPDEEFRNCWMEPNRAQIFWKDEGLSEILEASALIEVWNGAVRPPLKALFLDAFAGLDAPMALSSDGRSIRAQGRRIDETPGGGMRIVGRDLGSLMDGFGDAVVRIDEFSRTLDRQAVGALRRAAELGHCPLPGILRRFDSVDEVERFLDRQRIGSPRRVDPGGWDRADVGLIEAVDRAMEVAYAAHAGQLDKIDAPSIEYPVRVACRVRAAGGGEDAEVVAWLHDVVEDTEVTLEDIDRDFGRRIADAVDAITRRDGEGDGYYRRVAANPIARLVKVHDIADNTAPERTGRLDPATRDRLAAKYAHARELLGAAADGN